MMLTDWLARLRNCFPIHVTRDSRGPARRRRVLKRPCLTLEHLESRTLLSAGDLDLSFSGDGRQTIDFAFNDQANAVAIQGDGKIVVAGFDDGGAADFAVARLNPDGSLDTSSNGI